MRPLRASLTRRTAAALGCVALVAGTVSAVSLISAGPAAGHAARPAARSVTGHATGKSGSTEFVPMASSGSMKVHWRGNGHGHGMSQYGARGAALKGLSTAQILAFYYPGTKLTTVKASTIRVLVSEATSDTTVFAGTRGLKVTSYGVLPTSGYTQFRLAPSGSGLALQGRKAGTWKTIKRGLPSRGDFSSSSGWVQLLLSDGTSTRYRGSVGALRSGSGELTINRVSLDGYAQGVAPREMPAGWSSAAVRAQAIAARSYAKSSMDAAGGHGSYDICDTTMCQVYGGLAHYDSGGHRLYADDADAVAGNANVVLTYKGAAIFAQYSASNGGATVDGGKPYLVGKTDPYDTAASGDPYLDETDTVSVPSLASSYGLRAVSSIQITRRDGNGPWGGRIESAYVNGTTKSGGKAHVSTTGFELGDNMGVYTDYLRFDSAPAAPAAPSEPTSAKAAPGDAGAMVSWRAPGSTGNLAITGYRVRFGTHTLSLPATARSAWAGPLSNMRATSVTVQAVNAKGAGDAATVKVKPVAAPQRTVAVTPKRLFDTRTVTATIDKAHPYRFAVPGHGSIPKTGTKSVQFAVSVLTPSASGVLTIASSGVDATPLAALAYRAGHTAVATVSVPLAPSSTLVFTPSAGHVELLADQQSYTAAAGALIKTAKRQDVAVVKGVPTGAGKALSLNGLSGITANTKGVLLAVDATTRGTPTWLRVWPDGAARAGLHVAVTPYASGANTLIVPVGSAHRLRIAAGARGVTARVTLLGVLGTSGGRFETFPASAIRDGGSTADVGTAAVTVAMVGVSQVPATGVNAVLMQVTVRSTGRAGRLWVYPGQVATAPAAPAVIFAGTGSATATALVRVGPSGALKLKSSVPGVHVSVDAIGYITTH